MVRWGGGRGGGPLRHFERQTIEPLLPYRLSIVFFTIQIIRMDTTLLCNNNAD